MAIRVGAAAFEIIGDDEMVVAGGIHPRFVHGQEGKLRASAIVLEARGERICLISCDVLMLTRDILDEVGRRIEVECSIPFSNILIAATHTHHSPSTVRVHGYDRDDLFLARLKGAILGAARQAAEGMEDGASLRFWLGKEEVVGQNSRLLLSDGTIYWVGPYDDEVRPTGPFDPDLPLLAFQRGGERPIAWIFGHSTHNIGTRMGDVRSPGFYGLALQELEEEVGGVGLFLLGAAGSTHNLRLSPEEMIARIKKAVKEAFNRALGHPADSIKAIKREINYKVRHFDEDAEEEAVANYCRRRIGANAEATIDVFRKMREALAPHRGEERRTWLQAIRIGDIALVGIPGELFTSLGLEIKRRSPFPHTVIASLANDWIGYIPDREGFRLGGYQVWTGFHSLVAEGTGEEMVERTLQILEDL